MPRVSIIMPTYNRADTILRAVESIRSQPVEDWELVVIDDGSTDATRDLLAGVGDARIRVFSQENQGTAPARNHGFREARGDLIAFLDSDDVWPAHHLELAVAFFNAHPGEDFYSSECWEDFGKGVIVKHWRVETSEWYPATAAEIGSKAFAAPPPLGDSYMHIYSSRAEVGEWGRAIVERSGYRDVFHYRGDIFNCWRWGWLMALHPTVITRRALDAVGPFDTSIYVANDFGWLAELCRRFTANFFSIPGSIKHELSGAGQALAEDHVVTGKTAVRFHQDVLEQFERMFWSGRPGDPELCAIRGFRQYLVGEAAARKGQHAVALEYLRASSRTYHARRARELRWLLEVTPPTLTQRAHGLWAFAPRVQSQVKRAISRAIGRL